MTEGTFTASETRAKVVFIGPGRANQMTFQLREEGGNLTITVVRGKKVLGTISRSRRTFTAKDAPLKQDELAAITLFMSSVCRS